MIFIETSIFTRSVKILMSDEDYVELQKALILNPELGDIIQGSGGIRKMRWGLEGRGKRGGVRVIYFWKVKEDQILFLMVYPKNVQENLTKDQLKTLKRCVEEELNHEKRFI